MRDVNGPFHQVSITIPESRRAYIGRRPSLAVAMAAAEPEEDLLWRSTPCRCKTMGYSAGVSYRCDPAVFKVLWDSSPNCRVSPVLPVSPWAGDIDQADIREPSSHTSNGSRQI